MKKRKKGGNVSLPWNTASQLALQFPLCLAQNFSDNYVSKKVTNRMKHNNFAAMLQ